MPNEDLVTVENYLAWGRLIKTWATGESYFKNPPIPIEKLPIPRTLEELRSQAKLVGAGVFIPDTIKGFTVIQHNDDTMVIKLPPKGRIKRAEARLTSGPAGEYPFPPFYEEFIDDTLDADRKLQAHACRIGDYTISMCG